MIGKIAHALDADRDELLVLAEKVPEPIRRRVLERPDAFGKLARLDDVALDRLVDQIEEGEVATAEKPRGREKAKAR